jgi:DNA-binding MarR family transcriptional regulator
MGKRSRKVGLPLFDVRARRDHPLSSHAECQRQNDELTRAMEYALLWVRQYPGRTAKELEQLAGCEPGRIWKVIAQLERRHLVCRQREGAKPMRIYPL